MAKIRSRPTFVRFLDLTPHSINCDLHIHTLRTDGHASIEAFAARAVECGLERIAFTEHVRRETDWFSQFANEIRDMRTRFPWLEVLIGCEAKALDMEGALDASPEILAKCEIVLGSVHRLPDGNGGFLNMDTLESDAFTQMEFELARGLLLHAPIDVLAHPGGMYARRRDDFPADLMRALLQTSLTRSIAVEISTSYLRDLPAFLKLCAEVNPYVSIGSDAHRLEQLGFCRDRLREYGIG